MSAKIFALVCILSFGRFNLPFSFCPVDRLTSTVFSCIRFNVHTYCADTMFSFLMAVMFSHHYRKILLISDFRKARVSRLSIFSSHSSIAIRLNILNISDSLKNEVGFGSTEYIVFRAKDGISYPDFVYYLVISSLVREPAIKSMVGSSGRQRVQQTVIDELEIPNYSLAEQQHIVDTKC